MSPAAADRKDALTLVLRLTDAGSMPAARSLCHRLLRKLPRDPEVLHTAGALAAEAGNWAQAVRYFRRAAAACPRDTSNSIGLAIALWSVGRPGEGAEAIERALRRFPRDPDLLSYYARFLAEDRDPRALAALKRASARASNPVPLLDRAAAMADGAGKLSEAADLLSELLRIAPDNIGALNRLASVRSAQGRVAEALELFRRAVAVPGAAVSPANHLLGLHYDHRATPEEIFAAHRTWASRVETAGSPPPRFPAIRRNRLRVGYVSGDFRLHAVAYFSEPILGNHDPCRVEVHCFDNSPFHDRVTPRFRRIAAGWHPISGLGDDEAADAIRRARIDVLVDMSGHSSHNRLMVFARKPAPIQANYMGYPNTSGLMAMDYRFTDSTADPPGQTEHLHSETLVRLDPCFFCYRPLLPRLPIGPAPCETNGYVTLACFAIRHKLSPILLEAWAEILRRAPRTRLLLKCYSFLDREVSREMEEFFRDRGISRSRLELACWAPTMRDHLLFYRRADLMLDTYPYNGTTMTCEALSRGVPVLTWSGATFVSRVGASPLKQVALDSLVATSASDYVERAVDAASDRSRLVQWRRGLRAAMHRSSLMHPERVARKMEDAYLRMWRA